jgi:hypothetical protein
LEQAPDLFAGFAAAASAIRLADYILEPGYCQINLSHWDFSGALNDAKGDPLAQGN